MRVVVAEDVLFTREGLVRMLEDAGVDVVGQAGDGDELLAQVRIHAPDVAIADIRMPPTHTDEGLVAARRIRADHPAVGVLVLSSYVEPRYAMDLIQEQPERSGYLLQEPVVHKASGVDSVRRLVDG